MRRTLKQPKKIRSEAEDAVQHSQMASLKVCAIRCGMACYWCRDCRQGSFLKLLHLRRQSEESESEIW